MHRLYLLRLVRCCSIMRTISISSLLPPPLFSALTVTFWFYMAMQGDIIERYEVLNYFRQHNQKVTVKAENNGGGKSEDIEIVRIMEQHQIGRAHV